MFDLKVMNAVLLELEDERGIPREKMIEAIEMSLASAYKKEFGKRGQIITASFDINTGTTNFNQIKIVVDESMIKPQKDEEEEVVENSETTTENDTASESESEDDNRVYFDEEKHIMLSTARLIKKDVKAGDELPFPLEPKDDFGRIAAQTAKQVIVQKIREAERETAVSEYGQKVGTIVTGFVQRFERGNLFVDLGRITAIMPYDEQIPGERFKPGERIRALLFAVEETPRGVSLRLSRAHPDFLTGLFTVEAPELQVGTVEVKAVAREAGSRSKIAVFARDQHLDPIGSLVGQRGVRVSTVMSELGGEKIDIIEWSEDPEEFIEDALSPAQVLEVKIETEPDSNNDIRGHAVVKVTPEQQSLAIGRGGINVRLAAKLTGWKIDIVSTEEGSDLATTDEFGNVDMEADIDSEVGQDDEVLENTDGTTTKPALAEEDELMDDRSTNPDTEEFNEVDTPEEMEALVAAEEESEQNKNAETK